MNFLKITQADIDYALSQSTDPLSYAIKRETGRNCKVAYRPYFSGSYLNQEYSPTDFIADVYYEDRVEWYRSGSRMAQFLKDWEEGKPVEPQCFTLVLEKIVRHRTSTGPIQKRYRTDYKKAKTGI